MRISRVVPQIDHRGLGDRYQVFSLRRSNGKFGYADEVFDRIAAAAPVASVAFRGGSRAWVMVRRGPGHSGTREVRDSIAGRRDLAFSEARRLEAVGDRDLLQLCLAAVAGDGGIEGASNVCGSLLVASLASPNTEYFRGTSDPSSIHALEVAVGPRMELELRVRTFTSCAARHFKRSSPRFELADARYLRRVTSFGDPEDRALFCQGSRWEGDRFGGFAFMDASCADAFSKSKLGILRSVLTCMEDIFDGLVRIGFEEADDMSRIDCADSRLPDRLALVSARLRGTPLCVCDVTGELESQATSVAETAADILGRHVAVSPDPEGASLLLVHDRGHYADLEADPYRSTQEGVAIQHMTPASGFTRTATAVALKELVMKQDVVEGRMSLFDWRWGDWSFAMMLAGSDESEFAFLDVTADGSMSFRGPTTAIGAQPGHEALVEALLLNEGSEFAVRGPEGDVNAIGRTELFGMPNFEAVWHDLVERREDRRTRPNGRPLKHAIGRGKADRELYFADATDVASCRTSDGRIYYRVGLRGSGMQYSATHKASVLREVVATDGSRSLVDDLLPMLDVSMVRWGQPTVMPFPIKYLREWVGMKRVSP